MTQQVYKVLGQRATTSGDFVEFLEIYMVPQFSNSAVISTIVICNRAPTATTFSIGVVTGGGMYEGTVDIKHLVCSDTELRANDSIALTLGITMGPEDIIAIKSPGEVSFSVFGSEIWSGNAPI